MQKRLPMPSLSSAEMSRGKVPLPAGCGHFAAPRCDRHHQGLCGGMTHRPLPPARPPSSWHHTSAFRRYPWRCETVRLWVLPHLSRVNLGGGVRSFVGKPVDCGATRVRRWGVRGCNDSSSRLNTRGRSSRRWVAAARSTGRVLRREWAISWRLGLKGTMTPRRRLTIRCRRSRQSTLPRRHRQATIVPTQRHRRSRRQERPSTPTAVRPTARWSSIGRRRASVGCGCPPGPWPWSGWCSCWRRARCSCWACG